MERRAAAVFKLNENTIIEIRLVMIRYFKKNKITIHTNRNRNRDKQMYMEIDDVLAKDKMFINSKQQKEYINKYIYNFEKELIKKTFHDIFSTKEL